MVLTRAFIVASLLGLVPGAAAQVSPGPLARPHEKLDSATQCFSCHGDDKDIDQACVDCHAEIRRQLDRGLGLHGREALTDCSRCHPDHAGRDFELVEWSEGDFTSFDHGRVGWPLTGPHRNAACRDCHRPDRQVGAAMRLMERADPGRSWLGLTPDCASCHRDAHRGTLGETCEGCHAGATWAPATGFDHAKTAYPLDGAHVEVACSKCHEHEGAGRVFAPLEHGNCASCHEDVHRNAYGPDCASCHVTAGFKQVRLDRFDHGKTRFPLTGRHTALECARCHDPARGDFKREDYGRCGSCHEEAHAGGALLDGRAVDCGSCHDERGFVPATMTVAAHDRTAYPLEGAHRRVACASCHTRDPTAAELGSARVRMRPAFGACADCHDDAHDGRLADRPDGGACVSCHTVEGWTPSHYGIDDHDDARFRLTGAHRDTGCEKCHGAPKPSFELDSGCIACHEDPHAATLDTACEPCHTTETFRPSSVNAEAHRAFDYPLVEAHRTVPCIACHESLTHRERRPMLFEAEADTCVSCHASPHGGQFGQRENDCAACHDERAFVPAPRFDHDATGFPLAGEHRAVACSGCHARRRDHDGVERVVYRPVPKSCESCHKKEEVR